MKKCQINEIRLCISIMTIIVVNIIAMFVTGTKGMELIMLTLVSFVISFVSSDLLLKRFLVR